MLSGVKIISVAPRAALMLMFTGCALQSPKPVVPATPEAFVNLAPNEVGHWPSSDWYQGFASQELNTLIAQATNQEKLPLFAESTTTFFVKPVDAQFEFVTNGAGAATGLVLHQGGHDLKGVKQ